MVFFTVRLSLQFRILRCGIDFSQKMREFTIGLESVMRTQYPLHFLLSIPSSSYMKHQHVAMNGEPKTHADARAPKETHRTMHSSAVQPEEYRVCLLEQVICKRTGHTKKTLL